MAFARLDLGHGIGLRARHYARFLEERPDVGWVEAVAANYLSPGAASLAVLDKVRRDMPVALHAVALALGSTEPLNLSHLDLLRDLVRRMEPAYVSEHLAWGRHAGKYAHEVLPLPHTREALALVIDRVRQVQDALRRQILIENVASYVQFTDSEMPEWEFLARVAEGADCGILLDVTNLYLNARNHGFDPLTYLRAIPPERVGQLHLAGHRDMGTYLLDTHDTPVCGEVWTLYRAAVRRFGRVPALVEWDDRIPSLEELIGQGLEARRIETEELG